MKRMLMLALLGVSALGLAADKDRMDNSQAQGYFNSFMHRFDDSNLTENENRAEYKWFLEQGENGRDFVRDIFNNKKLSNRERFAGLYMLCKGWPVTCEKWLARCERSKDVGFPGFGRRLREYLVGEVTQEHQVR